MNKKYLLLFCCVLNIYGQAIQVEETKKQVFGISLEDLIIKVVQENAKIQSEKIKTEMIEQDILYEKGNFESDFFVNVDHTHTNKQNSIEESIARDQQSIYKEDISSTDIGFRGVNVYGTQWSTTLKTYSRENSLIDSSANGIDKEYVSALYLEFKQPILRGFGSHIGQININLAKLENKSAKEEYKKQMMRLIEEVVVGYWKLYGSYEIFKTWKETVDLIVKQKLDIQKKVRAGNMPRISLLQIESALSSSKVEMYNALDMVEKEKNNILLLLNSSITNNNIVLLATDKPMIESVKIPQLKDAIDISFANFPDFNIIMNKIEQSKLNIDKASDEMRPSLDFVGKINNDNLDRDFNGAISQVSSDEYISWYAGFNFSIPIGGNMKASSELIKQKLKSKQLRIEKTNLKNTLVNELDLKIKDLKRDKLRHTELKKVLDIKNEISRLYTLQLKYGRTNAKELMDVYADAILAKRKYLKSIIDIKVSESVLYKTMGTLLKKYNINLK